MMQDMVEAYGAGSTHPSIQISKLGRVVNPCTHIHGSESSVIGRQSLPH